MKSTLFRLLCVFAIAAGLAGCAATSAQNPGGALSPVNAPAGGPMAGVMLKGADLVAYFTVNKYLQGNPGFVTTFEGVTFWFSSAENKALFDKDPMKYQPQYGGFCANGINYGIPWGGDADAWRMVGGKLYIFGGAGSRDAFLLEESRNIQLADKYWAEEVAGSNSLSQRSKRLINRVPHYQTGSQLAKAVADAKAQGKFPGP
jgi:YHS domain-containing protein